MSWCGLSFVVVVCAALFRLAAVAALNATKDELAKVISDHEQLTTAKRDLEDQHASTTATKEDVEKQLGKLSSCAQWVVDL